MAEKIYKAVYKKTGIILVFILLITFDGCAGLFNLKDINGDSLDEGFSSVVMLRLRITDKTDIFFERMPQVLLTSRRDNAQTIDWISGYKDGSWSKKDGAAFYDRLIVAEAKPSDYLLAGCNLQAGNYSINVELGEKNFHFTVKPGEIYYLGILDISILSLSDSGNINYTHTFRYNYTAGMKNDIHDQENDIQQFKTGYPGLYKKSGEKINTVKW